MTKLGVSLSKTFFFLFSLSGYAFSLSANANIVEKIVFSSDRNGDFDIFIMSPDGSDVQPLVVGAGDQTNPELSPDGGSLGFNSNTGSGYVLTTLDLSTGLRTELATFAYNLSFKWSKDGTYFLPYLWPEDGCGAELPRRIHLDGSIDIPFSHPGNSLIWGDDGEGNIYFTSDPCWTPSITVNRWNRSSGTFTLLQSTDGKDEQYGDVSPDGSMLAYWKADNGYWAPRRIYLMDSNGANERQLSAKGVTLTSFFDTAPDFSPDGSKLVFTRYYDNQVSSAIYVTDVSGTSEEILIQADGHEASWGLFYDISLPADSDGDGLPDVEDNCPLVSNNDQLDSDFDLIGDVCDTDDDNDLVDDLWDNCPLMPNSDQSNIDNDQDGDVCDSDRDNDLVFNESDNCAVDWNPDQGDIDDDNIGDACDRELNVTYVATYITGFLDTVGVDDEGHILHDFEKALDKIGKEKDIWTFTEKFIDAIEGLVDDGRISFSDGQGLIEAALRLLPKKEAVEYEAVYEGNYIYHIFTFDLEQIEEMAVAPYRAQPYAISMIETIWNLADGLGSNLGKLVGKLTLAFQLNGMANESLDLNENLLHVTVRSRTSDTERWILEASDSVTGIWACITQKMCP